MLSSHLNQSKNDPSSYFSTLKVSFSTSLPRKDDSHPRSAEPCSDNSSTPSSSWTIKALPTEILNQKTFSSTRTSTSRYQISAFQLSAKATTRTASFIPEWELRATSLQKWNKVNTLDFRLTSSPPVLFFLSCTTALHLSSAPSHMIKFTSLSETEITQSSGLFIKRKSPLVFTQTLSRDY